LDLGHLNPESIRPEIGAANLWNTLLNEGRNIPRCLIKTHRGTRSIETEKASDKLANGADAFQVYYRQDHGGIPGRPGQGIRYLVKKGLSVDHKKRVALSILMEVTVKFENLQRIAGFLGITDSGYSQEDLVSNLIGFYIAVGEVSRVSAMSACHPISDVAARAIWDREGSVGSNKNTEWQPLFARSTCEWRFGIPSDLISKIGRFAPECVDECSRTPKQFPKIFQRIVPIEKGIWHEDFF